MEYTVSNLKSIMEVRGNGFNICYDDFGKLLGKEVLAKDLLASLFRWTGWTENHEERTKSVERDGWIRKSAKDLAEELRFTRSAYERARRKLRELGIAQCRRERKVHGMMTWKLDIRRLTELRITQVYGEPFVEADAQIDRNGFRLPEFVPLDLWEKHQKALYQKHKTCTVKDKRQFVEQLAALRDKGFDIRLVMQRSIDKAWFGFFDPIASNAPQTQDDGNAAAKAEYERQMAAKREAEAKPPDKPRPPAISPSESHTLATQMLQMLKGKKTY